MHTWISPATQLPPYYRTVLVTFINADGLPETGIAFWTEGGHWRPAGQVKMALTLGALDVTHWQPAPKPAQTMEVLHGR